MISAPTRPEQQENTAERFPQFNIDGIPPELASMQRWIPFLLTWDSIAKKWKKKPTVEWSDPSNARTLHELHSKLKPGQFPGFLTGGEYVVFDLDNCCQEGGCLTAVATDLISQLGPCYISTSVSGKGLHIVCKVEPNADLFRVPPGKTHFEFYPANHPIALTGNVVDDNVNITLSRDVQSIIETYAVAAPRVSTDWQHWSESLPHIDGEKVVQCASAYVQKMSLAVQGNGGSTAMMKVCSALRWGFQMHLEEAWPVLDAYNRRCSPPFDSSPDAAAPDSLMRKWDQVTEGKGQSHPMGNLLVRLDPFCDFADLESEHRQVASFAGRDATEFAAYLNQPIPWLVDGFLVADEPGIIGAAEKTAKTLINIELGVALATGTTFMGEFNVPRPLKVLMITGETNRRRVAGQLDRACRARGLGFSALKGKFRLEVEEFPSLGCPDSFTTIKRDIQLRGFDVVILDPLYPAFAGMDTDRLSDIGASLRKWVLACKPASVICSHHATKAGSVLGHIPERRELTGAGIREVFGQWMLIGRLSPFSADEAMHELGIDFGGRDCFGGSRRIVFDEKEWQFEVSSLAKHRKTSADAKQQARAKHTQAAKNEQLESDKNCILEFLSEQNAAKPKGEIEAGSDVPQKRFRRAFQVMESSGEIIQASYKDSLGRGQNGWIRTQPEPIK